MKIIIFIAFILIYKFTRNLVFRIMLKRYQKKYLEWTQDDSVPFVAYQMQILKLFKSAEIPDSTIRVTEVVAPMKIERFNISVFENMTVRRDDFYPEVNKKFDIAIGVYTSRMIETFNPLYWIDFVLFAPKRIIQNIGFDTEKVATKLCSILLTFIWWAIIFFLTFFYDQIKLWIIDLLS